MVGMILPSLSEFSRSSTCSPDQFFAYLSWTPPQASISSKLALSVQCILPRLRTRRPPSSPAYGPCPYYNAPEYKSEATSAIDGCPPLPRRVHNYIWPLCSLQADRRAPQRWMIPDHLHHVPAPPVSKMLPPRREPAALKVERDHQKKLWLALQLDDDGCGSVEVLNAEGVGPEGSPERVEGISLPVGCASVRPFCPGLSGSYTRIPRS